jgi:predicted alpha/beta hydrolase family esterase
MSGGFFPSRDPPHSGSMPTRALIVPALHSGVDDHWYPDLRERLAANGFTDVHTSRPPAGEPGWPDWMASIDRAADRIDENTVVIGHSLGAVAALAWLSTRTDLTAVGRFLGIAGFSTALPDLPTTKAFVEAVDAARIRSLVGDRQALLSEDDYAVPPEMTQQAAAEIGATVHRVEGAGHFLARDGWDRAGLIADLAAAP